MYDPSDILNLSSYNSDSYGYSDSQPGDLDDSLYNIKHVSLNDLENPFLLRGDVDR